MSRRSLSLPLAGLIALALLVAACEEHGPLRSSGPAVTPRPATTTSSATPSPTPPASTPPATPRSPAVPPPAATAPAPTPTATPSPKPAPAAAARVPLTVGVPSRLAVGTVGDLSGGRSLTLVEVTADSRCPADVQCIRAGEASLVFAWATPGTAQRVPMMASPTSGAADLGGGFRLRLLELRPTPITTRAIAPSEYVATVVVEPAATPTAGVFGSVTVGPSCSVQRQDDPCPDRPLAADAEAARTLSDAAGFYAVALRPGRYTVVPLTPGGAMLPRGTPRAIEVPVGGWLAADISYDSGIR